jgi:hypothetical protein
MRTIKTKNELPEWFKNKKYPKNLSAIAWYREVRRRQYALRFLENLETSKGFSNIDREPLINFWLTEANPNSPIFYIPQHSKPVQPLSFFETVYLRAIIEDDEIELVDEKLRELLKRWKAESNRKDTVVYSREYESCVSDFFKFLEENDKGDKKYLWDLEKLLESENPFLSYGRPLKGVPLTIDTQFDDQTILESVKRWLDAYRKTANEKARRPFTQNDFDDWTYYRIREISDLDTWAKLSDVRILDKVMANTLWSNAIDDISPIDILRTTARKKIKEVFTWDVAVRLHGQLLIQEGENFLEK